jgi:hypothetical protein
MQILTDSVFSDFTTDDLPAEPEMYLPHRDPANLKRRTVNASGDTMDGQPIPYDIIVDISNQLNTGDFITPDADDGFNYSLYYNGLIDYLSQSFKYTAEGGVVEYVSNVDNVASGDRIDLALVQKLWDGVKSNITDCVCNYDRCNCNSVCACNAQCSCNSDY